MRRWPALLVAVALVVLVGCTARTPLNPFDWYGSEFLTLYWLLCGTLFPLALWLQHHGRGPLEAYHGPPLTTYELARLAANGQLVADAALAALHHGGQLKLLDEHGYLQGTASPAPTHPYERAVWGLLPALPDVTTAAIVRQHALAPDLPALRALEATLEQRGLLLPLAKRQQLNRIPLLVTAALGAFGLVKVAVGLTRDRPVGFLLLSLAGLGLAYFLSQGRWEAWATGRGAQVLREAQATLRQRRSAEGLTGSLVALSVALFGVAELRSLGMDSLAERLSPLQSSSGDSSGSGCGSDGGSGCGGGGCGGCGGGD